MMSKILIIGILLSFLGFIVYEIVKRIRSRVRRRKQNLGKKGWSLLPIFTYSDGTMVLIASNHFHGHDGSRVFFVSATWKRLPRHKWLFDKIWDEEDHPIKKVRKDGKYALVDEKGNIISGFYADVKISFPEIRVRKGEKMMPLKVVVDSEGIVRLQEP